MLFTLISLKHLTSLISNYWSNHWICSISVNHFSPSFVLTLLTEPRKSLFIICYLKRSIHHLVFLPSGIPRDANIFPLLLSLFINSVSSVLKYSKLLIFVDDVKLYSHISFLSNFRNCHGSQFCSD